MPIEITSQEIQLLLRQFDKGSVVLFAGAGFSMGAKNRSESAPPLASQLCEILAASCGWKHEGEDLAVVYDQAQKHLGTGGLNDLLSTHYKHCTPAPWHRQLTQLFWYRIYTTNIDDVLENSYGSTSAQKLSPVIYPSQYQEQDMWYDEVQCVHLHGSVVDFTKGFTFTFEEFASQTAQPNPWYQAMADDMISHSFVFVGTRLNDAPFYHYLNMRSQRSKGTPEVRAKAFLVVPTVSHIRKRQLADQGIVVLESTGEEFFETICRLSNERVATRFDLLSNRYPHQIATLKAGTFEAQAEILRQFDYVHAAEAESDKPALRSAFFEGAEPTWDDIRAGMDAKRQITYEFLDVIKDSGGGLSSFVVVGQAGSGKSTILRRMAHELAKEGFAVYFSKSAQRLEGKHILDFLESVGNRHIYMFIDDAIFHLDVINELAAKIPEHTNVTFILADRPHVVYPRLRTLSALKPTNLDVPLLNREDCEEIIDKLKQFGRLGELQGKSRPQQLQEFLGRSKKQLLVAMKEATSGKGFNVILLNEFQSLSGHNARLAYTIACLAYMHGAPVRRRHLLACMDGSDIEKAQILANDLREVVVSWKERDEILCPRHRVIALQVATETAPFEIKKTAVLNYLSQISADMTPQNISKRTPEFIAYRGIINFDNMLSLFGEDYDVIEGIYNELRNFYPRDFLFWLQFGRSEIYFDHFSIAENYLKQSLGIRERGNFQARHQMGVLYLKRASFQQNSALAIADANQGEEILREQISQRGELDAYPYAALITHKLRYLKKWKPAKMGEGLEELYKLAQIGIEKHPGDEAMTAAHQEAFREYLSQAVKTTSHTNQPPAAAKTS